MRRRVASFLAVLSLAAAGPATADDASSGAGPAAPSSAPASAEADAAARPTLTLPELVRAARVSYPGLKAAAHRIDAAEARLSEATWSPYFQFTANAAASLAPVSTGSPIYSRDSQLPVSNPWEPVLGVGVDGAIPLWTFGKLSGVRTAARAGVRAAKEQAHVTEQRVIYDVRRAYFALQMSLDIAQMLSEGEGKLRTAEKKLGAQIESGDPDVNPLDKYRLSTALAELEARRAEALKFERSAHDALVLLTGVREFDVPECPLAPVTFAVGSTDEYVKSAATGRPELKMLDAGLRARKAQASITEAAYLPDLALGLSASYSYAPGITDQTNPFIVDRGNYQNLQAGLVARWNLDFVGHTQRLERVEAELAETRAQSVEARAAIDLETRTTHHELREAEDRMNAWQPGHKEARAWFVAAAQGYQVGTVEPKELIDAVKAYFGARYSHLQAIMDFNVAVARLERAAARDLLRPEGWALSCDE